MTVNEWVGGYIAPQTSSAHQKATTTTVNAPDDIVILVAHFPLTGHTATNHRSVRHKQRRQHTKQSTKNKKNGKATILLKRSKSKRESHRTVKSARKGGRHTRGVFTAGPIASASSTNGGCGRTHRGPLPANRGRACRADTAALG